MTPTFGPQLIGETEKTLQALLRRALADTGLDERLWVALRVADQPDASPLRDRLADRAHFEDADHLVTTLEQRRLVADDAPTVDGRALLDRVHLGDQPVEHLAVAVQKAHQRRAERFTAATHVRHRHLDGTLRGASPSRLVAVTRPHLTLAPALIPAPAAQIVSLLGLQQFLHDQPGHRLHQHRDDIRLPPDTTGEQLMSCSRLITDGATLRIGLLLSSVLNTRHDRAGHLDLQAG
jgi:hypothetical protein